MKIEDMIALMSDDDCEEYLRFERIKKPLHRRPDLCAFLMLDRLVPGKTDMVSCAEHDEIWLSVEPESLAKVATKEQIIDLVRCGLRYSEDTETLCMFV